MNSQDAIGELVASYLMAQTVSWFIAIVIFRSLSQANIEFDAVPSHFLIFLNGVNENNYHTKGN